MDVRTPCFQKKGALPVSCLCYRGPLMLLNNTKLILNDQRNHLVYLIQNKFGIIQNLQKSPVSQTRSWRSTFFGSMIFWLDSNHQNYIHFHLQESYLANSWNLILGKWKQLSFFSLSIFLRNERCIISLQEKFKILLLQDIMYNYRYP